MTEEPPRRRHDLASILLLTLFALKLAVLLVDVDNGFELGDEGYFLLNLNHPEAALPPFEIYRVIGALCRGCEIGVVGARLWRIAAELAGSLALVGGVYVWARARVFERDVVRFPAFLAWCSLGTLLSVASRSLGYNDLSNLACYAAVGTLFALAALPAGASRRRAAAALLAGVLTGVQLAVKFPPALLLAAVVSLVLGLGLGALSGRERLRLLAGYAAGAGAVVAFGVWGTGGAQALAERLAVASRLPALTGYDPAALLVRSVHVELFSLFHGAVFLLVFGLALRLGRRRGAARGDRALARALGAAALVLLAGAWRAHPDFLHWSLVALGCLLVGLTLALLVVFVREREPSRREAGDARSGVGLALLLVLLALPFVLIAGTNVPFTMRLPTHALPLFVLLALLVLERRGRAGGERFARLAAVLLVALTGLVFVRHHWLHPYGLPAPMDAQREAVAGLRGVFVDRETARFLQAVASSMREAGYRRGDPVIAFDYMPGLVHYLGGTSPRYNLYMFDLPAYDCFNANQARFERPPFVIVARLLSPALRDCLEAFRFPDDFTPIRTLPFPYEEVYEGFAAHGFTHVTLYAPRAARDDRAR